MNRIAPPIVWVFGFAIALVAIYTAAFGIIDEIFQRSITVAVSVILTTLATPLANLYPSKNRHIKIGYWTLDFILIFLMMLSILWFSSV